MIRPTAKQLIREKARVKAVKAQQYQKNKKALQARMVKYRNANRDAALARSKKWYEENRALAKKHARRNHLRRNYRMTEEEYKKLSKSQKHRCAICRKPENGRRLAVDHCHTTGRIRGLLCSPCNQGLGVYELKSDQFKVYLLGYA